VDALLNLGLLFVAVVLHRHSRFFPAIGVLQALNDVLGEGICTRSPALSHSPSRKTQDWLFVSRSSGVRCNASDARSPCVFSSVTSARNFGLRCGRTVSYHSSGGDTTRLCLFQPFSFL